jgi:hypothetical protein
MATISNSYRASSDLTISLASLASSATWVAGRESSLYDNSSNLDIDARLAGKITVGTTPTTNTQICVWVAAEQKDAVWPDVLDGTDSAETWTNAEMRDASAKLAAVINVVSTTSDLAYPFECGSVAALFGGFMPKKFVVFVAHNCGAALNATGGNHVISVMGLTTTVA